MNETLLLLSLSLLRSLSGVCVGEVDGRLVLFVLGLVPRGWAMMGVLLAPVRTAGGSFGWGGGADALRSI